MVSNCHKRRANPDEGRFTSRAIATISHPARLARPNNSLRTTLRTIRTAFSNRPGHQGNYGTFTLSLMPLLGGTDGHYQSMTVTGGNCSRQDWGSRGPGFKSRQPDHTRTDGGCARRPQTAGGGGRCNVSAPRHRPVRLKAMSARGICFGRAWNGERAGARHPPR